MAEPAKLRLPVTAGDLVLRELTKADAEQMVPYYSNPEVCRYIPWEPRDVEGVFKFIEDRVTTVCPSRDGQHVIVGIELTGVGIIGQLNFTLTNAKELTGEFGYVVNPAYSGQGFATNAVSAFISILFGQLGMRRITAWIDERNTPSIALVERLGLRRESREVEVEYFKGEYVTMLRYALLAREWQG